MTGVWGGYTVVIAELACNKTAEFFAACRSNFEFLEASATECMSGNVSHLDCWPA